MTTKKCQPNIKALVHLFANGEPRELSCGSVTSSAKDAQGDTHLFTYNETLATRRKIDAGGRDKNTVFLMNTHNYSITSSKHRKYLRNSVGCELMSCHIYPNCDETLDFKKARKNFKRYLWDGYAVMIPTDGAMNFSYSHNLDYGIKTLSEFLTKIKNPRVTAVDAYNIENQFLLLLKLQWYEKHFLIPKDIAKNKKLAGIAKRFGKAVQAYLTRNKERQEKFEKRIEESQRLSRGFVDNLVEQHSISWQLIIGSIATRYREDVLMWKQGKNINVNLAYWIQQDVSSQSFVSLRELWAELNRKFISHKFYKFGDLFEYLYSKLIPEGTLVKEAQFDRLRVWKDNVETTQKAVLSVLLVQKYFQKWKAELKMNNVLFGRDEVVGVYPLRSIKDGIVTIGCHSIRTDEILELAYAQGW